MRLRSQIVRGGLFVAALIASAVLGAVVSQRITRGDPGLASSDQPLEIKDLITRVREELTAHELEMRQHQDLALFRLKEFQMEINYVIRTGSTVKAEVVGVGTDLGVNRERVQKLVLHWDVCPEHVRSTVAASTGPPPASTTPGAATPIVVGPVRAAELTAVSSTGSNIGALENEKCN